MLYNYLQNQSNHYTCFVNWWARNIDRFPKCCSANYGNDTEVVSHNYWGETHGNSSLIALMRRTIRSHALGLPAARSISDDLILVPILAGRLWSAGCGLACTVASEWHEKKNLWLWAVPWSPELFPEWELECWTCTHVSQGCHQRMALTLLQQRWSSGFSFLSLPQSSSELWISSWLRAESIVSEGNRYFLFSLWSVGCLSYHRSNSTRDICQVLSGLLSGYACPRKHFAQLDIRKYSLKVSINLKGQEVGPVLLLRLALLAPLQVITAQSHLACKDFELSQNRV